VTTSLSQAAWSGAYDWAFLRKAQQEYRAGRRTIASFDYFVAYASRLYTVVNGARARGPRYWPLGLVAFMRLYRLLRETGNFFKWGTSSFRHDATPDQCETLTAILLRLSEFGFIPSKRRAAYKRWASGLVRHGMETADPKSTSPHTRAFLSLHAARLPGSLGAVDWSACLGFAVTWAPRIEDPNQQSRAYRLIAEGFFEHGLKGAAANYMDAADAVPNIGDDVRVKNAASRRRMRL
jgi:hypothetical protein